MNTFVGYGDSYLSDQNLSLQLSLGSTEYPQRPVRGYAEAYYRLLRSLGIIASQSHSLAITREDFNGDSFILATDCEKHSGVSSTGQHIQGVDVRCEGRWLGDGQRGVDRCYFTCHYEVCIEIRAGSVTLLA